MSGAAETICGINRRNVALVYAHNQRRHYPLADDKLLTKERLTAAGVAHPRTWVVCRGLIDIPAALTAISDHEQFVVKPARSSGGRGLVVVGERLAEGKWRRAGGTVIARDELRRHFAEIVFGAYSQDRPDVAYVEDRIAPHPTYAALWPDGLCDVRLLCLEGRPLLAMVRVPTARSQGRANLHQGGIGLAVELETGVTTRAWYRRDAIRQHPDTGAPLLGLTMPRWASTVATAETTARAFPLGFLGVDVVVDALGRALVLEINARPGLEIQNVHGLGLGAVLGVEG